MTAHGGTNPNASCSRLVSRMVISSALAPARLSLAPCSPPSRTLRAASRWPEAILDRSCAQRLRELRPGRRNGSQPRNTRSAPRLAVATHTEQRGGKKDGRVAGVAQLVVRDSVAELDKLFVEPESLKSGIGRALLDWAKA